MTNSQFPLNDATVDYFDFLQTREEITDNYFEKHHIYPTSIFGKNDEIIKLSYRDHFMAHYHLVKIYELAGMKRQYMQMSKALFSFVNIAKYRKKSIMLLDESGLNEIANLIDCAKRLNRDTSFGEMNGFYGKTHSPETMAKILETKSKIDLSWSPEHREKLSKTLMARDPNSIKKNWIHNPSTGENLRISNDEFAQGLPNNFILGKFMSDEERLHRSLRMQEVTSYLTYDWVKRGEEHRWYNTRHIFNRETGERRRILNCENLPDGFEYGIIFSESWHKNHKEAMAKLQGVPKPWVQITNRNPEKIAKTAAWHTGKVRSESAKKNIREGQRNFYDNGGKSSTHGKKRFFNPLGRRYKYFQSHEIENAKTLGFLDVKTFKVTNKEGNFFYIAEFEELPEGYEYAPNCGQ